MALRRTDFSCSCWDWQADKLFSSCPIPVTICSFSTNIWWLNLVTYCEGAICIVGFPQLLSNCTHIQKTWINELSMPLSLLIFYILLMAKSGDMGRMRDLHSWVFPVTVILQIFKRTVLCCLVFPMTVKLYTYLWELDVRAVCNQLKKKIHFISLHECIICVWLEPQNHGMAYNVAFENK